MRRFWRLALYRLRLRPTYWTTTLTFLGGGVVEENRHVYGHPWATDEDMEAANAAAWADTCRRLGGRRNVVVTDSRRVCR